jgi:hypothetical protein
MSNGLDHPLVRDYLASLETALDALPADQAAELREQITAHLDDALPPDANEQVIASVLDRLGQPSDLAAEAAAAADHQSAQDAIARRARKTRLRWRVWSRVGIVVVLLAVGAGYVVAMHSVGALQVRGSSAWWYPQDNARQVVSRADGITQTTAPLRSGKRQGYVIDIYNPSNWTQTVLGEAYGNWIQSPGAPTARFAVSARTVVNQDFHSSSYKLPGVVPPHQTRAIRVLWVSTECMADPGQDIQDVLLLQVRVGWVTRKEVITLNPAWALEGPSNGKYAIGSVLCPRIGD